MTPDDAAIAFQNNSVTKSVYLKRSEAPSTLTPSSSPLEPYLPSSKPGKPSQKIVATETNPLLAQPPRTKEAADKPVYCFVCLHTRILAKSTSEEPVW
jgi:hypothetical protein